METPQDLLIRAGWQMVRHKNHQIWRCPCGEHQVVLGSTPSDHRADKNNLTIILRAGCPSLRFLEEEPEAKESSELSKLEKPKVSSVSLCHFCRAKLSPGDRGRKWVSHSGIAACLTHQGIQAWHQEQLAREKKSGNWKRGGGRQYKVKGDSR